MAMLTKQNVIIYCHSPQLSIRQPLAVNEEHLLSQEIEVPLTAMESGPLGNVVFYCMHSP